MSTKGLELSRLEYKVLFPTYFYIGLCRKYWLEIPSFINYFQRIGHKIDRSPASPDQSTRGHVTLFKQIKRSDWFAVLHMRSSSIDGLSVFSDYR